MNLVQFLNLASGTAANGANAGKSQISLIVMMVLLFAVMYFVMIRPQKKKQKEERSTRIDSQLYIKIRQQKEMRFQLCRDL